MSRVRQTELVAQRSDLWELIVYNPIYELLTVALSLVCFLTKNAAFDMAVDSLIGAFFVSENKLDRHVKRKNIVIGQIVLHSKPFSHEQSSCRRPLPRTFLGGENLEISN